MPLMLTHALYTQRGPVLVGVVVMVSVGRERGKEYDFDANTCTAKHNGGASACEWVWMVVVSVGRGRGKEHEFNATHTLYNTTGASACECGGDGVCGS